jgi:uncharacterized protein YndB with AHSA1/START domain
VPTTPLNALKPNELTLSRVFDAPAKTVWEAWTDSQQVARWWGPRGFTITTHSKDLRPGGHWRYTMHGPDGKDWPNVTTYHEVEPLKKLVYDHGATDTTPPLFRVTVLFREVKGQTHMDMTMACASPEAAQNIRKHIKSAGGESTWDRLAEYLGDQAGRTSFNITRSFETDVETMFDLWTNPEHLAKWLPPAGMTMTIHREDMRPGGTTFFSMTDGKSLTMYGRIHYLEIRRPNRLVSTQEFVDKDENLSRHPLAPTFPASMLRTVLFTAETPTRTRVSVTWAPHGETTAEEVAAFVNARPGMTQGWTGSFEKLERLLGE